MNEQDACRLLESLAEDIPDTPTNTEALLRRGKRRLVRRRGLQGAMVTAIALGLVAGAPGVRDAVGRQQPGFAIPSLSPGSVSTSTAVLAGPPQLAGTWTGSTPYLAVQFRTDPQRVGVYFWQLALRCGGQAGGVAYVGLNSGSFTAIVRRVEPGACPLVTAAAWHRLAAATRVVADGTSLQFYYGRGHHTLNLTPSPPAASTGQAHSGPHASTSGGWRSNAPTTPTLTTPPIGLTAPPPSTVPQETWPGANSPSSPVLSQPTASTP